MKLLLTNDDGIGAAGLEALFAAAVTLGDPVVVAPIDAHSGCGHRVTTGQGMRIEPRGSGRFTVSGTPSDCVRLALHQITPDADWVLSGVNHGANLGADVHHSGTVAAVREAALHGKPAVAISQYLIKEALLDWRCATAWIVPILRDLFARPHHAATFWNINLPQLESAAPDPEVVYCRLDPSPLPLDFRQEGELWHYAGDYRNRRRKSGTDVDVCFGGKIAVTRLSLV
jgi:5'-nucleotidase